MSILLDIVCCVCHKSWRVGQNDHSLIGHINLLRSRQVGLQCHAIVLHPHGKSETSIAFCIELPRVLALMQPLVQLWNSGVIIMHQQFFG